MNDLLEFDQRKTLQLRCSSLPLVMACAASTIQDGPAAGTDSEAARLGSAVHLVLTSAIAGQPVTPAVAAQRHQIGEVEEVERLAYSGWRCWEGLRGHFPDPATEVALEYEHPLGVLLTGHADVLSVPKANPWLDGDAQSVRICDFKTGRLDYDHSQQLRGYCYLALQRYPNADKAYAATVRVREQLVDGIWYERDELDAWFLHLLEHLQQQEVYHPGPHCRYCPRGQRCDVKTAFLRQAAESMARIGAAKEIAGEWRTGPILGTLLDQVKLLEQQCSLVRDLIRAEVALAGGTLRTGDNRELVLVEQCQKRIDFRAGWPLLLEELIEQEGLLNAVTISKTRLEDAIRAVAPAGGKAKAVAEVMAKLAAAEAITETVIERLEVHLVEPSTTD